MGETADYVCKGGKKFHVIDNLGVRTRSSQCLSFGTFDPWWTDVVLDNCQSDLLDAPPEGKFLLSSVGILSATSLEVAVVVLGVFVCRQEEQRYQN